MGIRTSRFAAGLVGLSRDPLKKSDEVWVAHLDKALTSYQAETPKFLTWKNTPITFAEFEPRFPKFQTSNRIFFPLTDVTSQNPK